MLRVIRKCDMPDKYIVKTKVCFMIGQMEQYVQFTIVPTFD